MDYKTGRLHVANFLRKLRKIATVRPFLRDGNFTDYEIDMKLPDTKQLGHIGVISIITYSKGDLGEARHKAELDRFDGITTAADLTKAEELWEGEGGALSEE